ncbi:NUDIX hydrolase [Patescibacteria group bacterium]|nr:NUDIX hydrolase [Patescibacteria group bacterium]
MKTIQKVVTSGVLVRNGKVLLVQRSADEKIYPNLWELPSGKKEIGENCQECLIREMKEEIGIDVYIDQPISIFDYVIEKDETKIETTQINFLIRQVDRRNNLRLSKAHQAYRFFSKEEISRWDISEQIKNVLNITFDKIANSICF